MRARFATPVVCALCCIIALGATLFSARAWFKSYAELSRVRLDPLGLSRFADQTRPTGVVVVLFGDSRAAHWPAPPGIREASIINRGISGQTSAQVLARYEAHVGALTPEVVVLQVGGNDLKTVTLFPEHEESIIAECIQNIRSIVDRANRSGATVVVTTVFPHGQIPLYRRPIFDRRVTEATKRVNAEIRRMAAPGVVVMDCDEILAGTGGLIRPEYSRDLLHLTPGGYEALNHRLASVLGDFPGRPVAPEKRDQGP